MYLELMRYHGESFDVLSNSIILLDDDVIDCRKSWCDPQFSGSRTNRPRNIEGISCILILVTYTHHNVTRRH